MVPVLPTIVDVNRTMFIGVDAQSLVVYGRDYVGVDLSAKLDFDWCSDGGFVFEIIFWT